MRIGIRREDKNEWEKRVPLTPQAVETLTTEKDVEFYVQPSSLRIIPNDAYENVGALITDDLSICDVVLAIKEIPLEFLQPNKIYMFFSHTIKGQSHNMPMLRRLMELGCTLIDYELVRNDSGRLIFFGRQAGLAGMIDSLWALGKRLDWEGIHNPFLNIKRAFEYENLKEVESHISQIGTQIEEHGIPPVLNPLIVGITGYGNVSLGVQEILDLLPCKQINPSELYQIRASDCLNSKHIFKTVFREEDMFHPVDAQEKFELQDYYNNPRKYRSHFENYISHLTMLINCIYWEPKYPRLVTKDYLRSAYSTHKAPLLRVIGDISIDIEGSIECSIKATNPGNPVYVYNPISGEVSDGWEGYGPVVMAVDNLPSELAGEASEFFSNALIPLIEKIIDTDFNSTFDKLELSTELKNAVVVYKGKLTPKFEYLAQYLH